MIIRGNSRGAGEKVRDINDFDLNKYDIIIFEISVKALKIFEYFFSKYFSRVFVFVFE